MRRALSIALTICVLSAASYPRAQSHNSACIYQGMLVTHPLEWCMRNGQSTLALNQLQNPSPQEAAKFIQMLLVGAGFDPGLIDGDIGPKTRSALKEFQQKVGLPANGEIDDAVVSKLAAASTERTMTWAAANSKAGTRQSDQNAETGRDAYKVEDNAAQFKGLAVLIAAGAAALLYFLWKRKKQRLAPYALSSESPGASDRTNKSEESKPNIFSSAFAALVSAVIVLFIVMLVGGLVGVGLQMMFRPILGEDARAFAFVGPVLVVGVWVYAKYFTTKGIGNPKNRGVALAGLFIFALLMAYWAINEPPPTPADPEKEAEQLAKPCIGTGIARAACELNKENIRNAQQRRMQR